MGLKESFFKQFEKPTGNLGIFIGWLMSFTNREISEWTFGNLRLKPTDTILEIGYGPGITLKKIADNLTTGFISGIDHSEIMFNQAKKRNKKHISNKKVKIDYGKIWDLKYPDNYFDTIFGSNVHFFWENPVDEFKKLVSWLKPDGRLVMIFQPRWTKSEDEVEQVVEKIKKEYEEAGLKNIEVDLKKMKPVTCIYIGGQK